MRRARAAGALLAVLAVLPGCDGRITGGGAAGGRGSGTGVGSQALCGGPAFRRLTRSEYDNAMRDLLGATGRPSGTFPADIGSLGFDNNAKTLTLPPVFVEQAELVAESLVDAAWTRDQALPASSRKLLPCDPARTGDEACLKQLVSAFAPRAWRRPVTDADVADVPGFLTVAKAQGEGFDAAARMALAKVLSSPYFLFHAEALSPKPDHAVAARLAALLWSSIPDDALRAAADQGALHDVASASAQARRMLADPKSEALVADFAGQWLGTRYVEGLTPDPQLFPNVTAALKTSMRLETEAFFRAFLTEPRSALDMLDADFTYVDDALAAHYGLPAPGGSGVRRVTLAADSRRGGLLTQATVLATNSVFNRTSIVKRGKWVLGHLLCKEPPPPPPNVPPLAPATQSGQTQRQREESHRTDPVCASCHVAMDLIGFGLENFDAVGAWRTQDDGAPIDATGAVDGTSFDGPKQLAAALKADPALESCLVRTVYGYALGRSVDDAVDRTSLEALRTAWAAGGHRLSDLLVSVAASRAVLGCDP